jgi:hypothetical protein
MHLKKEENIILGFAILAVLNWNLALFKKWKKSL